MTDDIQIPDDTRKSRLPRDVQPNDEEFVRADDRFAAFRRKHKEGHIEATIDRIIEHPDGHLTYIVHAAAWKQRPGGFATGQPDATGWAQGSTKDTNPIIASAPLESAETIARSRALRNLGILARPKVAK